MSRHSSPRGQLLDNIVYILYILYIIVSMSSLYLCHLVMRIKIYR